MATESSCPLTKLTVKNNKITYTVKWACSITFTRFRIQWNFNVDSL